MNLHDSWLNGGRYLKRQAERTVKELSGHLQQEVAYQRSSGEQLRRIETKLDRVLELLGEHPGTLQVRYQPPPKVVRLPRPRKHGR